MRLAFAAICVLALLATACPRRRNFTRIVYTLPPPNPPGQVDSGSEPPPSAGTLVIQELPPEPEPQTQVAAPVEENPRPAPRRRRPSTRVETPAPAEEPPPEPPALEVPALEPRTSAVRQASQRREIESSQQAIQRRIDRLDGLSLSGGDRKTLDDARTFLMQSTNALKSGELERAHLLAHKAELLVSALEQEY